MGLPSVFEIRCEDEGGGFLTRWVTPGCEWVLRGEGGAREIVDGSPCAIIGGKFYRWDGSMMVKVDFGLPSDAFFINAYDNSPWCTEDGVYRAVGVHFHGNPYGLDDDFLERCGRRKLDVPRSFDGMREFLRTNEIQGVEFWKDGEPRCQILRKDFGFEWPVRG